MSLRFRNLPRVMKILLGLGLVLGLALAAALVYRQVSGRSLGLRSFAARVARPLTSPVRSLLNHQVIIASSRGDFNNILFLHHSTGRNLINYGAVRERFGVAGYSFWDHDYNDIGLRDPQGSYTGYDYRIPNDNTDTDGYAVLFGQRVYDLPINALSRLLQHEVIILKSCFPNSNIQSDSQLEQKKALYRQVREAMGEHPQKLFIIVTQPPLNPAATNLADAGRARELASWLGSDDFLRGYSNIVVFDFFDLLAERDPDSPELNMLREDYREGTDSHPNRLANEMIGPIFVDFVIASIEAYRPEDLE